VSLLAPKLTLAKDPEITLVRGCDLQLLAGFPQRSYGNIRPALRHSHKEKASQVRIFAQAREDIGLLIAQGHLGRSILPTDRRPAGAVVDIVRVARTLHGAPLIPKVHSERAIDPALVEACQ
jgi:hypothetical protein